MDRAVAICTILAKDCVEVESISHLEFERRKRLLINACRWAFDDDEIKRRSPQGESIAETTQRLAANLANELLAKAR